MRIRRQSARGRMRAPALRWEALQIPLLLVGLVTLCGCGATVRAGATPTAAPTATATMAPRATPATPTAHTLQWTATMLPAGQLPPLAGGFSRNGVSVTPAQSDSATAYACAPSTANANVSASAWLTHDRGASWQALPDVTVNIGEPVEVTTCQMIVDTTQADTAVAQVGFLPGGGCVPVVDCSGSALYVTTDGGQTWAPMQTPPAKNQNLEYDTLSALATYHGATYALFRTPPRSASEQFVAFTVSRDHLRTWTPINGLSGGAVSAFWLNPYNGGLLALTSDNFFGDEHFLASADGGSNWTTLPSPPITFAFYDIAVQQPYTTQPWRICGGDPSSATKMDTLACTADGGATWTTTHLDVPNDRAGSPNSGANYTLVGIADDGGTLLTTPSELMRVVSGDAHAQALGLAPNAGLMVYAAGSGAGALWSAPGGGYADSDPHGRIYTASYA